MTQEEEKAAFEAIYRAIDDLDDKGFLLLGAAAQRLLDEQRTA